MTCKFNKTPECPFDDSDMGPPVPGTVKKCEHFDRMVFCPHYRELKGLKPIAIPKKHYFIRATMESLGVIKHNARKKAIR